MSDVTAGMPKTGMPNTVTPTAADVPVLPAPGTDGTYQAQFTLPKLVAGKRAGQIVELTLTDELVRQEIVDQSDLKKPTRTAIFRATQKRLAKMLKQGVANERPEGELVPENKALVDHEALRWDCFILLVDQLIDGKHVALRAAPDQVEALLSSEKLVRI